MSKRCLLLLLVIPVLMSISGCLDAILGPQDSYPGGEYSSGAFSLLLEGKSNAGSYNPLGVVAEVETRVSFNAKIKENRTYDSSRKYSYDFVFGNGRQLPLPESSSSAATTSSVYHVPGIYRCTVRAEDNQDEYARNDIEVWIHGEINDYNIAGEYKRLDSAGNVLCIINQNESAPSDKYVMRVYGVTYETPSLKSQIALPSIPTDICVYGDYAYVLLETGLLPILISNPYSPVIKTLVPFARGLDIAHEGTSNDLFVACGLEGIKVFSIAEPELPVLEHTATTKKPVSRILVKDNYAYCLEENCLEIISLTDLEYMYSKASLDLGGSVLKDIAIEGNIGYIINNGSCYVVNLANKLQPILIETDDSLYHPHALAIRENVLYVADYFRIGVYRIKESGKISFVQNSWTPSHNYHYAIHIIGRMVYTGNSIGLSAFQAIK